MLVKQLDHLVCVGDRSVAVIVRRISFFSLLSWRYKFLNWKKYGYAGIFLRYITYHYVIVIMLLRDRNEAHKLN